VERFITLVVELVADILRPTGFMLAVTVAAVAALLTTEAQTLHLQMVALA
jgi:hypothetical protein